MTTQEPRLYRFGAPAFVPVEAHPIVVARDREALSPMSALGCSASPRASSRSPKMAVRDVMSIINGSEKAIFAKL
jgi:hypothetical protein